MEQKQSSVDWLISCITEDQMVKSKSLNEWLKIFEQAKSKHKEEIKTAWYDGISGGQCGNSEQYYSRGKAICKTNQNRKK